MQDLRGRCHIARIVYRAQDYRGLTAARPRFATRSMCIVLIQGPHHAGSRHVALPSFYAAAKAAGTTLLVRSCNTLCELIECLHKSKNQDTEMVLLDSGEVDSRDFPAANRQLCKALDALSSPYIEMHDASSQVLDQQVHPCHGPIVTLVINDDRKSSYSMALAIALRRLQKRALADTGMPTVFLKEPTCQLL